MADSVEFWWEKRIAPDWRPELTPFELSNNMQAYPHSLPGKTVNLHLLSGPLAQAYRKWSQVPGPSQVCSLRVPHQIPFPLLVERALQYLVSKWSRFLFDVGREWASLRAMPPSLALNQP